MRVCTTCNKEQEDDNFALGKSRCNSCTSTYNAEYREANKVLLNTTARQVYHKDVEASRERERLRIERDPRGKLLSSAKSRAKINNIPFSITKEDITLTTHCPILGLELKVGREGRVEGNSFTLDKVIPDLGYVKGNVMIISNKANRLKSNSTLRELEAIVEYIRKHNE